MVDEIDFSPTKSKRKRTLDEDIVIWQGSQSTCAPLNQLIQLEASQTRPIPRIPSLLGLDGPTYLPRDLATDASSSNSSPAVRESSRKKRMRPSRIRRHTSEPEEPQGGDPSDFYQALRDTAERTSVKAQQRKRRELEKAQGTPPARVQSAQDVGEPPEAPKLKRDNSTPRTYPADAGRAPDVKESVHAGRTTQGHCSAPDIRTSTAPSASSISFAAPTVMSNKTSSPTMPPPASTSKDHHEMSPPARPPTPPITKPQAACNPRPSTPATKPSSTHAQVPTSRPSNVSEARRIPSPDTLPPVPTQSSSRPPALGMRRVVNAVSRTYATSPSQDLPMKRKGFKPPLLTGPQMQSKENQRDKLPKKSLPTPDVTPSPNDHDGVPVSPPRHGDTSSSDFETSWDIDQLHESLKQYDMP